MKITKDRFLDVLSERISKHMTKLTLEQVKAELETKLEAFDMDDFLWSDAADAARADIEREQGADSWSPLGDQEDPKKFVKGLANAKEKDVDANAANWKSGYAQFEDHLTSFLEQDQMLGQAMEQDPVAFKDAMALALYKYMMDHNSRSSFISSIQQWIVDHDEQFDPTDEEGNIELEPIEWRIYGKLPAFEKTYNRMLMAKKSGISEHVSNLKMEKSVLEEALRRLTMEVWEWTHSHEAYDNVRENLHNMPHDQLVEIMTEWEAFETAGGKDIMHTDFDAVDASKYLRLPNDVLADAIYEKAEAESNADNGGYRLWVCPYGCHTVSADLEQSHEEALSEDVDDLDIDGGELTDDPTTMDYADHAMDVAQGYYVVPPTATDPMWYVVNDDGDPVDAYSTEEEANAAIKRLNLPYEEPQQDPTSDGYGTLYKESRLDRIERMLKEAELMMGELNNYPVGAEHDPSAPYNQYEPSPLVKNRVSTFKLVDGNGECVILKSGKDYYAMSLQAMMPDDVSNIAINHIGVPYDVEHDEDGPYSDYDTTDYVRTSDLPASAIVDHVNHNLSSMDIGEGLSDWESGMHDLVKIDPALAAQLKFDYPALNIPVQ